MERLTLRLAGRYGCRVLRQGADRSSWCRREQSLIFLARDSHFQNSGLESGAHPESDRRPTRSRDNPAGVAQNPNNVLALQALQRASLSSPSRPLLSSAKRSVQHSAIREDHGPFHKVLEFAYIPGNSQFTSALIVALGMISICLSIRRANFWTKWRTRAGISVLRSLSAGIRMGNTLSR